MEKLVLQLRNIEKVIIVQCLAFGRVEVALKKKNQIIFIHGIAGLSKVL